MAVLEIRKFPDKILRKKAEPVTTITESDRGLIRDMFETMYLSSGVGLAAPQVGVSKQIIVCNPTGQRSDELAIINPHVSYRKGKRVKDCEGCLSIPEISAEVVRFLKISVTGKDPSGKDLELEAEGLLARIIAHECDHLEGILFIDRINFFKRKALVNKYKKKTGITCIGKRY